MRATIWVAAALAALAVPACGDGTFDDRGWLGWGPSAGYRPELWGDWFATSSEPGHYNDTGLRLAPDGTWAELRAPGSSFEPGERYCLSADDDASGVYVAGPLLVELTSADGASGRVALLVEGDRGRSETWSSGFGGQPVVLELVRFELDQGAPICEPAHYMSPPPPPGMP